MEDTLLAIRQAMRSIRIAGPSDRVYKDECMFSFASGLSEGGLYTSLQTFQSFGEAYVDLDHERTGNSLYLHRRLWEVPVEEDDDSKSEEQPSVMAIGIKGGFQVGEKKTTIKSESSLVIIPERTIVSLPNLELPQIVLDSIAAIEAQESVGKKEEVASWQEERKVSKYAANLEQLPCDRKIPMDPAQWTCDETGVNDNLWLNLSTGFIGSGRPHWDGSGGNGAAMRHFVSTGGKYPLVVKLGTITPNAADVYSYASDEDDMVTDPDLPKHLAHWGINVMLMEKTEKTMTELQIEKNLSFESDRITEARAQLVPLHGPGYVGLTNLGNSCYMNSAVQVLWALPETGERILPAAQSLFRSATMDPASDVLSQWAKLGRAIAEGMTGDKRAKGEGTELAEAESVRPSMFKALLGRGHAEFSSSRQQDAEEYFGHLLEVLTRTERSSQARLKDAGILEKSPLAKLFEFKIEDRIQCKESKRVLYKTSPSLTLGLSIPLDAASNREELAERDLKRQKLRDGKASSEDAEEEGERIVPHVPLEACLKAFGEESTISDYYSPAIGKKTEAMKRARVVSFPSYLVIQLRRYYVDTDWTARKLDVTIGVPEHISLEFLRGTGPQDDELLQPDEPANSPTPAPVPVADLALVERLVAMGFPEGKCRKAAIATGNVDPEAAMEWLLSHLEDSDTEDTDQAGRAPGTLENAEGVSALTGMGFTEVQAGAALKACDGNLERAADWLFSRMDDLDAAVKSVVEAGAPQPESGPTLSDSPDGETPGSELGEYDLVSFISHIGANTACGHYVCHIKKEGRWVLFNDDKVAVSANPPKELGYLYIFRRSSSSTNYA